MAITKSSSAKGLLAQRVRRYGPDDQRVTEARRDLAAELLAEHVQRVVAKAPPLTAEQRERIAAIVRGGSDA